MTQSTTPTPTPLQLLQLLYKAAKDNNSTGVLSNSKTLCLMGVSYSIQNRVLCLCNNYTIIEDISFTIQSMLDEVVPAQKIRIPQL